MMSTEQNFLGLDFKALFNETFYPQLFSQPADHRLLKHPSGFGESLHGRHKDPLKLNKWLLKENHIIQLLPLNPAHLKTKTNSLVRKIIIVLLASKSLFFGGCDHFSIFQQD